MDFYINTYQSDDISIKYLEKGSGKAVLFLIGGGLNPIAYEKILTKLSKKYRVVVPELPFFCNSDIPKGKKIWELKDYGNFFSNFIKFLNLKELAVIGHSLGGGIALYLASKNGIVKYLILIDSAGKSCNLSENEFRYKLYIKKNLNNLLQGPFQSFLIIEDFLKNRIKNFSSWPYAVKTAKKCLLCNFNGFRKIKIPTFILWGKKDEIFLPSFAKIINKEIPGSKIKFIDGNHDWIFFNPEQFSKIALKWLNLY